jgi:hypothetical protein
VISFARAGRTAAVAQRATHASFGLGLVDTQLPGKGRVRGGCLVEPPLHLTSAHRRLGRDRRAVTHPTQHQTLKLEFTVSASHRVRGEAQIRRELTIGVGVLVWQSGLIAPRLVWPNSGMQWELSNDGVARVVVEIHNAGRFPATVVDAGRSGPGMDLLDVGGRFR